MPKDLTRENPDQGYCEHCDVYNDCPCGSPSNVDYNSCGTWIPCTKHISIYESWNDEWIELMRVANEALDEIKAKGEPTQTTDALESSN